MPEKNINNSYKLTTQQPFHIVDPSGWPALTSIMVFSIFSLLFSTFQKLHINTLIIVLISIYIYSLLLNWFVNIIEENITGHHTNRVEKHFYIAIILFIASEVMFFFYFFWSLFHYSLAANIPLIVWPPKGIVTIMVLDEYYLPTGLPCLNTLILLLSGYTVTLAHRFLLLNDSGSHITWLLITIILGIFFTICQGIEYYYTTFTIQDTAYGSIFYLATGFHGFHVIIGTILLLSCLIKGYQLGYTKSNHFSFEASAWYWHFVDVVWLYLFVLLYYWVS